MANSDAIDGKSGKRRRKPLLYEEVSDRLCMTIKSENLRPGDRLPAITTLVDSWGVNFRTLKAAFDLLEQQGVIRQEPRKPAIVAASSATSCKLMFVRWQGDSFCMAIEAGINRYCQEDNVECHFVDANCSHERFLNAIVNPGRDIDGLLAMPHMTEDYSNAVRKALEAGTKVVFVDRYLPDIDASTVAADHFGGAYQAVKHLLDLHDCGVYYIGMEEPSSCRSWLEAWSTVMNEYNFFDLEQYIFALEAPSEEIVIRRDCALEENRSAALRLFKSRDEDKYCIFAGSDYVARGVYLAAEEMGLEVGKNVFVVGFGDMPLCNRQTVPLSSVAQNSELVGYEAARTLHEHLMGTLEHPTFRVMPVELKVRKSSKG